MEYFFFLVCFFFVVLVVVVVLPLFGRGKAEGVKKKGERGATKLPLCLSLISQKNIFSQRLPRGAQASLTCEACVSLHPGAERRTKVLGRETGAEGEEEEGAAAAEAAAEVADFLPTEEAAALAAARACAGERVGGCREGREGREGEAAGVLGFLRFERRRRTPSRSTRKKVDGEPSRVSEAAPPPHPGF